MRASLAAAFARPAPTLAGSPLYLLGLALTAGVVVLLPVLYLALIALVGWLVYWHATEHVYWLGLIRGRGGLSEGVGGGAPARWRSTRGD